MSDEIVEYLLPNSVVPNFTVDNTQPFVQCSLQYGTGQYYIFASSQGDKKFRAGDNVLIESYGLRMPESFAFYGGNAASIPPLPSWSIGYTTDIVTQYPSITDIAVKTGFNINENAEHFMNILFTAPAVPFKLVIYPLVDKVYISMLNVPTALNTKVYNIYPFIKIRHNKALY